MKKNYDEELLELSLEVWGQKNQVIVEDSPSEESIIDNEIVVGIYFPDTHMLSFNLTHYCPRKSVNNLESDIL